MASSFWDGDFHFNGVKNTDYKVCIVDFNTNDILKQYGINYSVETSKEASLNFSNYAKEIGRNSEPLTLQLCKIDGSPFTVTEIININGWLFQNDYKQFQTVDTNSSGYNIIYYLKAISFNKFLDPEMRGYLEYTFESHTPYAYIKPNNNFILSDGQSGILSSVSNIGINYQPKILLDHLGEEDEIITIKNETTGTSLSLKGVKNSEHLIIDCQMGTVVNSSGENRFEVLQNYNFIDLARGNNEMYLTGNSIIEVICEYPVIL